MDICLALRMHGNEYRIKADFFLAQFLYLFHEFLFLNLLDILAFSSLLFAYLVRMS